MHSFKLIVCIRRTSLSELDNHQTKNTHLCQNQLQKLAMQRERGGGGHTPTAKREATAMMQGEAAEMEERCGAKRQKICSAQLPLYVHLTTKEETNQETREDGTRQFPFRTVEAAEKAFSKEGGTWVNNPNNAGEDDEVEIMHCAGSDLSNEAQCSYPKCTVSLCVEHGSLSG